MLFIYDDNFLTEEEQNRLINFALNNKIWDVTETHIDEDGLVLYDSNVWADRVCTVKSLEQSDPTILKLYGVFNHDEVGIGQPRNMNRQKSFVKKISQERI